MRPRRRVPAIGRESLTLLQKGKGALVVQVEFCRRRRWDEAGAVNCAAGECATGNAPRATNVTVNGIHLNCRSSMQTRATMFRSISSMFSKPKPPPQNFRVIHRPKQEGSSVRMEASTTHSDTPLPPNVYISPHVPAEKPGPNWLRMVCISDTHNTTDANNYPIPEADILGKPLTWIRIGEI